MKTKIWVTTTLAFFIAAIGYATDFPQMNVITVEAEKALVAYKSSEATPLEITLTNCNGEILYFKRTQKRYNEYKKVFDFSELGSGNYCVCVNFGNRSISRNLTVDKKDITVGAPQRLYEPYFCMNDKKLNVSFFNCPQKPVYVNIYQNGQHIQGINLGKDLTIQKRLDLSNLKKGEYEVVLSDLFKDHKYIAQL
jgi:hypothetical protein